MTYCFAFSLNPDGLAVISDTRVTTSTRIYDGQQKVFFPTPYSFVAVAGNVANLEAMLTGISERLMSVHERDRMDQLIRFLDRRCEQLPSLRGLTEQSLQREGFAIIYGDTRRHRSGSRARLVRLELRANGEGTAYLDRHVPPRDLGWVAIGTAPGTRAFLGNTAAYNLGRLEQRGLVIRVQPSTFTPPPDTPIYSDLTARGVRRPHERQALILDSSGPRDGTFRKVLRQHYREQLQSGNRVHQLSPLVAFATAAKDAIAEQVAEFKTGPGLPDVDGISDTWCIATISNPEGAQLYTETNSGPITSAFSLRPDFTMMRPN
ncbi:hypothetical protein GCM10027321_24680 [Massilia terrae]